jgi:hypothetical protein
MDASQYKDYVLVLLFIKYVSDKYAGKPYQPLTIPPGASFADMMALKGKSDIGDRSTRRSLRRWWRPTRSSRCPTSRTSTTPPSLAPARRWWSG